MPPILGGTPVGTGGPGFVDRDAVRWWSAPDVEAAIYGPGAPFGVVGSTSFSDPFTDGLGLVTQAPTLAALDTRLQDVRTGKPMAVGEAGALVRAADERIAALMTGAGPGIMPLWLDPGYGAFGRYDDSGAQEYFARINAASTLADLDPIRDEPSSGYVGADVASRAAEALDHRAWQLTTTPDALYLGGLPLGGETPIEPGGLLDPDTLELLPPGRNGVSAGKPLSTIDDVEEIYPSLPTTIDGLLSEAGEHWSDPLYLEAVRIRGMRALGKSTRDFNRLETYIRHNSEYPVPGTAPRSFIIYDGDRIRYYDRTGQLILTAPASSGRSGVVDRTSSRMGPIPLGTYDFYPPEITQGNVLRDMLGDWGWDRASLQPPPGTRTFGRGGFFLHGGELPGSAGCIDVGTFDRTLFPLLMEEEGPVTVYVVPPMERGPQ